MFAAPSRDYGIDLDDRGRLTAVVDELGATTRYESDAAGLPVAVLARRA